MTTVVAPGDTRIRGAGGEPCGPRLVQHAMIMRRTIPRWFLAAALALGGASAAGAPRDVTATYSALMHGITIGSVTERFEIDGRTYRITSETQPSSLASLVHKRQPLRFSSQGRVTPIGLQPLRFEARRSASDPPQLVAEFDWGAGQLVLRRDGNSQALPLPAGTQDRLSIMYHFMVAPLGTGGHVEFSMTNGRKLDRYRYRVAGEPTLETAIGRLKTIHLVKEREPGDTAAEIWLSPRHDRLAVRLIIVERNGVRFEQIIQSVQIQN